VVHVAASSSASARRSLTVLRIKQISSGVYELTPETGSAFFLRENYLSLCQSQELLVRMTSRLDVQPEEPSEAISEDLLHAALVYSCEKAAMSYLSRAEQCRAGLTRKLLAKGIGKEIISQSLDYLESVGYLDDFRFAGAWLRNRSIDHAEGRTRLSAELASRGVDREASKKALDEFFEEVNVVELGKRALKKLERKKVPPEKYYASLVRAGFSNSVIKEILHH